MAFIKLLTVAAGAAMTLTLIQCGGPAGNRDGGFKLVFPEGKTIYQSGQQPALTIRSKKGLKVDSVTLSLGPGSPNPTYKTTEIVLDLSGQRLGKKALKATIFSQGQTFEATSSLTILAAHRPTLYGYRILETYPHDPEAYTQGLEFHNDTLYESTGQYKKSSIRKTDYRTGRVWESVALEDEYFGEGLTILNQKIYQLTWRERTGFIYDLKTLERKGSFVYPSQTEGWGLCNDGNRIYRSDGTERIWIMDAQTLAEDDHIQVYTNTSKIARVNELEWVDGRIYANIYQKDAIAMVNPETGAVEGVIDLSDLKEQVEGKTVDVLNGIAYRGEPGILYVTGKNWDKLFKIEIVEK